MLCSLFLILQLEFLSGENSGEKEIFCGPFCDAWSDFWKLIYKLCI